MLFVVTVDWAFVTHRLVLARALMARGWRVAIATRFTEHRAALEAEGLETIPLRLRRGGGSLLAELQAILELRRLYRAKRPTLIHQVPLKSVVYGGLASLGLSLEGIINAVTGLGFLFTSDRLSARLGRPMMRLALRLLLNRRGTLTIVQNPEDLAALEQGGVDPNRMVLIRGAGVDCHAFRPEPEPPGIPVVLFAGRLLHDKGLPAFIGAARRLHGAGVPARFQLAGRPDPDAHSSATATELAAWEQEGLVELLGRRADMPAVLAAAHVVCLPTQYGEGVPKILLEAAAAGRPVVATDWPGCREVVRHEMNGLLVPPGDIAALATAITRLVESPSLRARLGANARKIALQEFSEEVIVPATLAVYDRLLSEGEL